MNVIKYRLWHTLITFMVQHTFSKCYMVRLMSIWGKIAGALTGYALGGGPIGTLLGGLAGHLALDRGKNEEANKKVAFSIGVIALSAKLAKADGIVSRDEVEAFREVFEIPESELRNVARVFDLAKQDVAGFESYAKQLAKLFEDDPDMLRNVLEALFHIAVTDSVIHPGEKQYLATVAQLFGIGEVEFSYILARYLPDERKSAYDVLGVIPSISNDELRKHYRKLVMENHPDRLTSRGLPEEMIAVATRKLAAINQAYDEIAKERQL
jgi:DnaJ like chaperone protein